MSDRDAHALEALEVLGSPRSVTVGAERTAAIRDVWGAFWSSRLFVWVVAIGAIALFGWGTANQARMDPLYLTLPFDQIGNLFASPAARFDSAWFLAIAEHGYEVSGRAAFFPLYPALLDAGGAVVGSAVLAGMLISSALSLLGLYLVHRLVSLDFERIDARNTVWIMAWFPSAFVLSAVYSEGLFLALAAGVIYSARLGRWPLAAALGGLAASTRSAGILLLVPLAYIYFYGPRNDRPGMGLGEGLRPHHPLRLDVLWLLLVPAGLAAYLAYLAIATGDPAAAFTSQSDWHRIFAPFGGLLLGFWSALGGLVELLPLPVALPGGTHPDAGRLSGLIALRDILLFGFLVLAIWLSVEGWRRLPKAYSAYSLSALALPLSFPATDQPLESLPRFLLVLFPLWIALALWARERGRMRQVIAACAPFLLACTALFATWTAAP